MNKEVCKRFKNVWDAFPDTLDNSRNYQFKDNTFLNNECNNNNFSNNYCNKNNFQSDLDRISAGCLYLLDEFIKDCGVLPSPSKNNPNIVDYILIWLSYMLNLDKRKDHNNIDNFYNHQIDSCNQYKTEIDELNYYDYDNYKELIDTKKELLYMDSNIVPKFYEAFKLLCNWYNELDDDNKNCKNYLEDDNEFVKKYNDLKKDPTIIKNSYYSQLLSTLSTDYDNFKKECEVTLSPPAETKEDPGKDRIHSFGQDYEQYLVQDSEEYLVQGSGQDVHNSDVASSSSSIVSKLIPVLLIFGAISIFLGISYKYSLFGFRKRAQKQYLREKIKNIKKRMNR
ncbi:hypothetical protein YYC_04822 [Plasmodium yoelii 17X]|uniref:YIR protein n=1 Tax=Plasmodium yoelii 17X TaxID=1323249 RepID=V7PD11_PLAYE|nr:hypothetical protein YYC_04822 [Plasmodium yoelii 17X]